jgi:hypothetical protein
MLQEELFEIRGEATVLNRELVQHVKSRRIRKYPSASLMVNR